MQKVFIVAANRSAIGSFGGSLKDLTPADLGTQVAKATIDKVLNQDQKTQVDELICGNVLGAGHGMNIARQICINSGLNTQTPAFSLNKVCGSGLKAVALAYQAIKLGENQMVLAGGVESMSQAGYVSLKSRWGARLGHDEMRDLILQDGLTDVFKSCHMGITAENLASKYEISRLEQDQFALDSQKKATAAREAGKFVNEIVAVNVKKGREIIAFNSDEYIRPETNIEALTKLKPAFKAEGTVTAGNASGINDGAAFLLLVSESKMNQLGLKPLAEIIACSSAALEPEIMGIGPVYAVKKILQQANISIDQIDLIEANEAFAAQAIAVNKLLAWDTSRVNPNGGAIALGHPIGASGARILVSLVHGLKQSSKSLGLATLCVGGGQGVAMLIKNVG